MNPHLPTSTSDQFQNLRQHLRVMEPPLIASEFGSVRDISMGGLSVGLSRSVTKGQVIEFILTDNHTFRTMVVQAEVMWASWRYAGLRWTALSDEQVEWLEQRVAEWDAMQAELRGKGGNATQACWFG
jgi:hypothetical protein